MADLSPLRGAASTVHWTRCSAPHTQLYQPWLWITAHLPFHRPALQCVHTTMLTNLHRCSHLGLRLQNGAGLRVLSRSQTNMMKWSRTKGALKAARQTWWKGGRLTHTWSTACTFFFHNWKKLATPRPSLTSTGRIMGHKSVLFTIKVNDINNKNYASQG